MNINNLSLLKNEHKHYKISSSLYFYFGKLWMLCLSFKCHKCMDMNVNSFDCLAVKESWSDEYTV